MPTSESLDLSGRWAQQWTVKKDSGNTRSMVRSISLKNQVILWSESTAVQSGRSLRVGPEVRCEVLLAAGWTGTDHLGSGAVELVRNGEISFTGIWNGTTAAQQKCLTDRGNLSVQSACGASLSVESLGIMNRPARSEREVEGERWD